MTTDEIASALINLKEMDLVTVLEELKQHLENHSDHPQVVEQVFGYGAEISRMDDELSRVSEQCDSLEEEKNALHDKIEGIQEVLRN